MKKTIILISAVAGLMVACTAKKATTSSTPAPVEVSLESKLSAVKAKYPDVTLEQLEKGKNISKTSCAGCHKEKNYTKYTDDKISHELEVMSKKAKLSEQDKQALIRYVAALRAN